MLGPYNCCAGTGEQKGQDYTGGAGQCRGKGFPRVTLLYTPRHQGCPLQYSILQKEKCCEQPSCVQWLFSGISKFQADLRFIPTRLLEFQDVLLN